ncbi:LOW QUALITY PROTEIN: hypothetical protein PHMEG_00024341 [Phytophthora megakarya]|uniref:Reverse transcriptase RNase H-like domain-containing protein n=1 Tax=Phytophthora megakarya TaxID=4795 RepID=A0A225VG59_9STRA|nr:LOW QUALITY PROTEIN: hypothetical protein PHMEG_00024341 [Phytophthora megakarya]
MLLKMVTLAHPKEEWEVCLFADASQTHFGVVVTQIPPADAGLPVHEQHHQSLAFLSGSFATWSNIDKEAFTIVISGKRLMHLLLRPRGFRIFTDHRNLYSLGRHQVDRLQWWAMTLTTFRYVIEYVGGEDNGDLLSRRGAGPASTTSPARMNALLVVNRVSPLQEPEFIWPTQEEIKCEQRWDLSERDPDTNTLPTYR